MTRPEPHEYGAYYHTYVDLIATDDLETALREEGQATRDVFSVVPEELGGHRYAEGKWSIKEVLGHLIDCERIFAYRALCFGRGETRSLPGYDHDAYVKAGNFDARRLTDMVDELRQLRESTLLLLASFDAASLDRGGEANGMRMTPRAIGFVLAGHEKHHREVVQARYL